MTRGIALATLLVLALMAVTAPSSLAVPVIVYHYSNGPWGGHVPRVDVIRGGSCLAVTDRSYAPVASEALPQAIRHLAHRAIAPLSDHDAARLLDLHLDAGESAAATFFAGVIARMNKTRSDELDHQVGSWSLADQSDLDGMVALVTSPRVRDFHPYLVRALVKEGDRSDFMISTCGDAVQIVTDFDLDAAAASALHPEKAAVILFLNQPPSSARIGWGGQDPRSLP
jgi:hypothetical protein